MSLRVSDQLDKGQLGGDFRKEQMEHKDYEDQNKTYTYGTIQDLKESFCSWMDNTFHNEGNKTTGYKIDDDGKIHLRVYDTYISSSNGGGGKTYQIVIEKEEQEVIN